MKKIAIFFTVFYVVWGFGIGSMGMYQLALAIWLVTAIIWSGYFFLRDKNLKHKEPIFLIGVLVIPFILVHPVFMLVILFWPISIPFL
jgi:drug/metabolite transporter (DMT)-like permease